MPKDDYPTCRRTYATLRIYHKTARPAAVSRALRLKPANTQVAGEPWRKYKGRTYPISGWFFTSEGKVESYDSAKHLFWLIDQVAGKRDKLSALKAAGWWMDISCMWDSAYGHGGPTLSPKLLAALHELGIELWFDVYFTGAYAWTKMIKQTCSAHGEDSGFKR
jgi:hypothetical protein